MSTNGPTCTCDAIEVTAKCPACPTAADQTPADDSERVEQIRARVALASEDVAATGIAPAIYDALGRAKQRRSLTLEDIRQAGQVAAEDIASSGLGSLILEDVPWLLARLAEQTALIERVEDALPWWEGLKRPALDGSLLAKQIRTALGSQQTEGQG